MVAAVLGLELGGHEISPEAVARAIGGKKLLLVLDNCEHVIDEAARLAETVIRLCPATSIVATSREVLRIEGEQVYRPFLRWMCRAKIERIQTLSSDTAPYSF
jgi:predicted ATPase